MVKYRTKKIGKMQAVRYWIIAILLTVALVIILSPTLASENSLTSTVVNKYTVENALKDIKISTTATVFAAGLLAGFNPCLLAILAFLASTMLASTGRRKDILTLVAFFP
jgi:cytochrome c biogenesis protein CcdA